MNAFAKTRHAILTRKCLTELLTYRYRQGIKLTGILYFHQITDNRMTGTLRKNFRMFQELCGGRSLRNVVIVTNRWEEVDRLVGEKRETELKEKDMFFKPVLERRAQMARHNNTSGSAQRILRLVLRNRPLPQRIQEEIVDQGMNISQTSAGRELDRDLWDQIRKHSEEMYELEEKRQQATKDNDGKAKKRLMREIKEMKDKIKGIENDSKRMIPDYQKMVLDLETHRTEIEKRLKESPNGGAVIPALIPILAIAAGATLGSMALPAVVTAGVVQIIASTILTSTIFVWIRSRR